jgi:hypothetical protein
MGVLGAVPGVEAPPANVRGTTFSMLEMYEAREPFSFVTERSQSDLPVEMTTCGGGDVIRKTFNHVFTVDELVGGRVSWNPAYQKSCLSSMEFFLNIPRVLWRPHKTRH